MITNTRKPIKIQSFSSQLYLILIMLLILPESVQSTPDPLIICDVSYHCLNDTTQEFEEEITICINDEACIGDTPMSVASVSGGPALGNIVSTPSVFTEAGWQEVTFSITTTCGIPEGEEESGSVTVHVFVRELCEDYSYDPVPETFENAMANAPCAQNNDCECDAMDCDNYNFNVIDGACDTLDFICDSDITFVYPHVSSTCIYRPGINLTAIDYAYSNCGVQRFKEYFHINVSGTIDAPNYPNPNPCFVNVKLTHMKFDSAGNEILAIKNQCYRFDVTGTCSTAGMELDDPEWIADPQNGGVEVNCQINYNPNDFPNCN